MSDLSSRKCLPCDDKTPKLAAAEVGRLLTQLSGWRVEGEQLKKSLKFEDFRAAMRFLNRVADLAEDEGHHPDFCVHYNRVDFTIWTHAVHGLSENDFILAAKIESVVG